MGDNVGINLELCCSQGPKMQPMWYCAGTPVDLNDTNWSISCVDTDAKVPLNPERYQVIEASTWQR